MSEVKKEESCACECEAKETFPVTRTLDVVQAQALVNVLVESRRVLAKQGKVVETILEQIGFDKTFQLEPVDLEAGTVRIHEPQKPTA